MLSAVDRAGRSGGLASVRVRRRAASTLATGSVALAGVLLAAAPCLGWEGTDSLTGSSVEIRQDQIVRAGRAVEYFDYGAGKYRTISIGKIRPNGSGIEIEGADLNGNPMTLDMDQRPSGATD